MKILILADDKMLANALNRDCEENRYEVRHAANAEDRMIIAMETHFDLIVLDCAPRRKDSLNVFKYMRRKNFTPILMLTTENLTGGVVLSLDYGSKAIINPSEFNKFVDRVITQILRIKRGEVWSSAKEATHGSR